VTRLPEILQRPALHLPKMITCFLQYDTNISPDPTNLSSSPKDITMFNRKVPIKISQSKKDKEHRSAEKELSEFD
jgi:hypothetical protein